MSINLAQFHQVFFEESLEGLDVMESALMELDPQAVDAETINAIFRAAHSIKGGSATFGMVCIAEFTHDLETILDQVRNGTRSVSSDDINIFFQSVDCMRDMIELLKVGEDKFTDQSTELKETFAKMLSNESSAAKSESSDSAATEEASSVGLWSIKFVPNAEVLKTGNEVTRLFRELECLGKIVKISCEPNLPSFTDLEPENCYLGWNIQFESDAKKEHIEEVFEWVDDSAEIVVQTLAADESGAGYVIEFSPQEDILRTGNDVLRLFNSLSELAEIKVTCDSSRVPSFSGLDPESCFLAWKVEVLSEKISREDIDKVFEWVTDLAEVKVSSHGDVVQKSEDATQTPNTKDKVQASPAAKQSPVISKAADKKKAAGPAPKANSEASSIRVGIDKVDNLINMVGELVITQSMLGQLGTDFEVDRMPKLIEGLSQLEQNTRELQESVMRIRMLPISFAFSRFPRMVRDLGQKLGKKIELVMLGEQTELDKTVMEKIGDPLVHLVRNAVDHGIEMPEARAEAGKPEQGEIILNAYHQGGNVVIEIKDNGKGLDREKIVAKAIEREIVNASDTDQMSDEQVFDLIFQPGFSTADKVSDVSGRGVGMDVVKRNIQALNGNVEIRSEKGAGSTITIRLPLTLAILDGQLIRVGNNTYIFPLVSIVESMQINHEFISTVAGGCSVFKLRDEYVPIIELHRTFSVEPDSVDLDQSLLVVVEHEGEKVGIVVDELMAQQQVVIKSLEQNYRRVDGISGATILGDGTVALIIDIAGVVKLAGTKFEMRDVNAQLNIAHAGSQSDSAAVSLQ